MNRTLNYSIPIEYDGRTVMQYLKNEAGVSSRLLKFLKRQPEGILLNGVHTRTVDILHYCDTLTVNIPEDDSSVEPSDIEIKIAYEDEDIIILNKPPFMPVHPTRNHQGDTLANGLANYLKKTGRSVTFRAVNRLDRDTSGLVVIGLNQFAASRLSGNLDKTYTAIVEGELTGSGTINLPIRRPNPLLIKREVGEEGGERAVTHWTCERCENGLSLLRIKLETGRTHQIRVHFSYIGYPLAGDTMYWHGHEKIARQALHCSQVKFTHPVSGKTVEITSPLPEDMAGLM